VVPLLDPEKVAATFLVPVTDCDDDVFIRAVRLGEVQAVFDTPFANYFEFTEPRRGMGLIGREGERGAIVKLLLSSVGLAEAPALFGVLD
jgi:hypothetical protein